MDCMRSNIFDENVSLIIIIAFPNKSLNFQIDFHYYHYYWSKFFDFRVANASKKYMIFFFLKQIQFNAKYLSENESQLGFKSQLFSRDVIKIFTPRYLFKLFNIMAYHPWCRKKTLNMACTCHTHDIINHLKDPRQVHPKNYLIIRSGS